MVATLGFVHMVLVLQAHTIQELGGHGGMHPDFKGKYVRHLPMCGSIWGSLEAYEMGAC